MRSFQYIFYAITGNRCLADEFTSKVFLLVEEKLIARQMQSTWRYEFPTFIYFMFIFGWRSWSLASQFPNACDYKKRYVSAQTYHEAIYSRWLERNVRILNCCSFWSSSHKRDLKTGSLVWIVEPTCPREYYLLARIVKFYFCMDVSACSAELKT